MDSISSRFGVPHVVLLGTNNPDDLWDLPAFLFGAPGLAALQRYLDRLLGLLAKT